MRIYSKQGLCNWLGGPRTKNVNPKNSQRWRVGDAKLATPLHPDQQQSDFGFDFCVLQAEALPEGAGD
jgi:hypothetical protein